MENFGIVLVILGGLSAITATAVLAGWPWALLVAAVLFITAGVLLVRTAALTPPKPKPEGGDA